MHVVCYHYSLLSARSGAAKTFSSNSATATATTTAVATESVGGSCN
jgi:hypothetical protein